MSIASSLFSNTCAIDETITSIVETCSGSVHVETVGETCENCDDEISNGDFTVLFQRGLLPNTTPVERSHRCLLSPLQIKSGESVANVPWKNFSWNSRDKRFAEVPRSSCMCLKPHCTTCFASVTEKNIKVVWMHDECGKTNFQWYVMFEGDCNVLTRVPSRAVLKLKNSLSATVKCTCGQCKHPLTRMPCARSVASQINFDKECVRVFSLYRQRINAQLKKDDSESTCAKKRRRDNNLHEGTCAICLEDTDVSGSTCVKKLCSLEICSDCHTKTRGLCPICDRSKLSESALFHCGCCNRVVGLKKYGHECIGCKEPCLCTDCYKAYGQCPRCELDIAQRNNS